MLLQNLICKITVNVLLQKLQVEIDNERNLREFEKHRRHAEKLVNENLLREKDQQIEDQNKILNWHVGILTEQQARLNEVTSSSDANASN